MSSIGQGQISKFNKKKTMLLGYFHFNMDQLVMTINTCLFSNKEDNDLTNNYNLTVT